MARGNPSRKKRPLQDEPQLLRTLQWNAGGMSQDKKTQLQKIMAQYDVDVFTIMEANLTDDMLMNYRFKGYTLYLLPKYRQIASGILTGVRETLTASFEITKEMGYSQDLCEIITLNVWKNQNHFKIYAVYNPPQNKPSFDCLNISHKTILIGDFNAHSIKWGYISNNAAGKEIEELLNSTELELIYKHGDPATYLHYNGTKSLLICSRSQATSDN